MPHSHHSHSGQFCAHAEGTLEEVVQAAIARGFKTFGLSEHVPRYYVKDLYPEELEKGMDCSALVTTFDNYLKEAHRLRVAYADKIDLLVGLETEYITDRDLIETSNLLTRYPGKIDYFVGSVHHVMGIPIDFDEPTFEKAVAAHDKKDPERAMTMFLFDYFGSQLKLMKKLQPEVIGHFDLCRLYRPSLRFEVYNGVWMRVTQNIRYAISYGALFEVNAAAFRKGWQTAYPGKDILDFIISQGGKLCLSDDSHGPKTVGQNYDRLFAYLKELGVKELWYLKREWWEGEGRTLFIRAESFKLEGDWQTNEFWNYKA